MNKNWEKSHKTASKGRLVTWLGIPVVHISATSVAALIWPLCADL